MAAPEVTDQTGADALRASDRATENTQKLCYISVNSLLPVLVLIKLVMVLRMERRPTGASFRRFLFKRRGDDDAHQPLAHSTFDLFAIVKQIVDAKAQYCSLVEPWADTGTSTGRLMLAVLGSLADVERDLIRTRTAEGRSRAKALGKHMGRPPSLTRRRSRKRPPDGARRALRCRNWRTATTAAYPLFDAPRALPYFCDLPDSRENWHMKVSELVAALEEFQTKLTAHQELLGKRTGQRAEFSESEKQATLQEQSRWLSRRCGALRPYIERFDDQWMMQHPAAGSTWDALDVATSLTGHPAKGQTLRHVLPKLHQILGHLDRSLPSFEHKPLI
jgi:hypothetical protein